MKAACGIEIDCDKTFMCLAGIGNARLNFIEELHIKRDNSDQNIVSYLQERGEEINQVLLEKEKEHKLSIDKIFVTMPWNKETYQVVEEYIPLRRKKRVTATDILWAKKYLEDITLDWDHHCLHHIVLGYEVNGRAMAAPPVGYETHKIKLKSLIVWVEDQLRKAVKDIFYNLDRNFSGFVSSAISAVSASLKNVPKQHSTAIFVVEYNQTRAIFFRDGLVSGVKDFLFGTDQLLQELSCKLSLPIEVADELFHRYCSFRGTLHTAWGEIEKEVSIKNGDTYVDVSIQTLNRIVKDFVKSNVQTMVSEMIASFDHLPQHISFLGRLANKEGFYQFLQKILATVCAEKEAPLMVSAGPSLAKNPYRNSERSNTPEISLETPLCRDAASLSFGCVRYGMNPFLENDFVSLTLWERLKKVYNEYF